MSSINVSSIKNANGGQEVSQEVSQDVLFNGTAKSWSSLDGTGTISAQDDFGIGSYTDYGPGDYGYNLSAAMANDDYSWNGNSERDSGAGFYGFGAHVHGGNPPTTTVLRMVTGYNTATVDCVTAMQVFGDLA